MSPKALSSKTRESLKKLKELQEKKDEARQEEREGLDKMLGIQSFSGKPRRSQKHNTYQPGRSGNK